MKWIVDIISNSRCNTNIIYTYDYIVNAIYSYLSANIVFNLDALLAG